MGNKLKNSLQNIQNFIALGMPNENFLIEKLNERRSNLSLRTLKLPSDKIDFYSNDYLGLARNAIFYAELRAYLDQNHLAHGSTGSRLISGQHPVFEKTERQIATFHQAGAALIFNSGYDANLGLFSSIASKGDTLLYDSLVHASIRDGIRLSFAGAFSFQHNDPESLEAKLRRQKERCFVVVESVYSMDGDQAPLKEMQSLCENYGAYLIVDEAHATGVIGEQGEGLVQHLGLQNRCFARVHTFGKALGVHGAAVVGSDILKQFLINYARPFIYTTALPPASVAAVAMAYQRFPEMVAERNSLRKLVDFFQKATLPFERTISNTPIQILLTPGNENAKHYANHLQERGFQVNAILAPTVPKGEERLRIVLHSFNTKDELERLTKVLSGLV